MREACVDQQVRRIVLIEPSEMALRRAALHASVLFPNAELVTINKGFDDLVDGDILSDEDTPTMHILSNVLDMAISKWNQDDNILRCKAMLLSKLGDKQSAVDLYKKAISLTSGQKYYLWSDLSNLTTDNDL